MNQAQTFTQTLNRGLGHPSISRVSPIVFVVDDDATVRDSLELLILSEGWQPETFQSAREFLSQPRALVPSCLIVDLSLSNLDGLELQKMIARDRAEMPIIFITDCGDIPTTVQAIKAGSVDFLVKPFSNKVLLRSIREGLDRSRVALDREVEMRELRNRHALLTPRERQVMTLVVSGLLNKQAGGELGISEITVKAHRGQVMQKMKANSLAGLVRMAADLHPARQTIHLA
jgi:FixJ family two-component response regulator